MILLAANSHCCSKKPAMNLNALRVATVLPRPPGSSCFQFRLFHGASLLSTSSIFSRCAIVLVSFRFFIYSMSNTEICSGGFDKTICLLVSACESQSTYVCRVSGQALPLFSSCFAHFRSYLVMFASCSFHCKVGRVSWPYSKLPCRVKTETPNL